MTRVKRPLTRPLTEQERRVVIFVKLHQRLYRQGPTWRQIREGTGLDQRALDPLMWFLFRAGVIHFSSKPHSTFATKNGVRLALRKQEVNDGS